MSIQIRAIISCDMCGERWHSIAVDRKRLVQPMLLNTELNAAEAGWTKVVKGRAKAVSHFCPKHSEGS